MTARFVDTNILLYAISRAEDERAKATQAARILDERENVVSTQVLQEFFVQATRASRQHALDIADAAALVEAFTRFRVQDLTVPIVRAAMRLQQRYSLSYWDAAIIEAARAAGCGQVLSEDLSDGEDYGGVVVVNPFRDLT